MHIEHPHIISDLGDGIWDRSRAYGSGSICHHSRPKSSKLELCGDLLIERNGKQPANSPYREILVATVRKARNNHL
jgi:hypothetical protein